jgi:hypothetical protein
MYAEGPSEGASQPVKTRSTGCDSDGCSVGSACSLQARTEHHGAAQTSPGPSAMFVQLEPAGHAP